jgi:large subunit ribosomal protein L5
MADDKKEKDAKPAKDKGAAAKAAGKPADKASSKASKKGGGKGETASAGAVVMERPKSLGERPRLAKVYDEKVRPELMKKFGYRSVMQAPRFVKIVLNMGVGDATQDQKLLDAAMNELGAIAGQRPSKRIAKKSISNFKLREGVAIGCAVTLRGTRMWEFYDRLINVAVPRIRDFRGLNQRAFDGRGNYTMGVLEHIIFPEINIEKIGKPRGMDVTIVTTAKNDEEGRELLRLMSMPFRQR